MKTALALFIADGHREEDWPAVDPCVRNHYLLKIEEPRMGSIQLSCGCKYDPSMGELEDLDVRYRSEECDAIDGFCNAIAYAVFCPSCKAGIADLLVHSDEEEDAWLSRRTI